ncbi:MAG: M48 family metalloprotease [Bacteroidota bacterium]
MHYSNSRLLLLGVCFILLGLVACQNEVEPPVRSSEITKAQREQLGDRIQIAIAVNEEQFPILPQVPPYDTTVYWYIQHLYQQVSFGMQLDNQSPADDRWSQDRSWKVTVLDLEERNAFVIPGGHFYVTTGLLRSLSQEYELYYLLAFEAALMNERLLLNRLVTVFNPALLVELANGAPSPNSSTNDIADISSHLVFDEEDVKEIDEKCADLICNTSIFDRLGIISLLDQLSIDDAWLINRPSYIGRADYIIRQLNTNEENCGSFQTNGGYQRYILNVLK